MYDVYRVYQCRDYIPLFPAKNLEVKRMCEIPSFPYVRDIMRMSAGGSSFH